MTIINWEIAKHPMNWLTLFFMVLIAGIVVHFILTHVTLGHSALKSTLENASATATSPTGY